MNKKPLIKKLADIANSITVIRDSNTPREVMNRGLDRCFIEINALSVIINNLVQDSDDPAPVGPLIEPMSYMFHLAAQIDKVIPEPRNLMIQVQEGFPAVVVSTEESVITTFIQDEKLERLTLASERAL